MAGVTTPLNSDFQNVVSAVQERPRWQLRATATRWSRTGRAAREHVGRDHSDLHRRRRSGTGGAWSSMRSTGSAVPTTATSPRRPTRRHRHLHHHRLRRLRHRPPPPPATASATTTATPHHPPPPSATATAATATTASASPPPPPPPPPPPLPRAAGDRAEARPGQAADPQGQLLRRPRPPRSHEAIAARPRHRAEPEARRRQAQGLPGQPARRPGLIENSNESSGAPRGAPLSVPAA